MLLVIRCVDPAAWFFNTTALQLNNIIMYKHIGIHYYYKDKSILQQQRNRGTDVQLQRTESFSRQSSKM